MRTIMHHRGRARQWLALCLGVACLLGAAAQDEASGLPTPVVGLGFQASYELPSVDPLATWNSPSTEETFSFGLDSAHFDIIGTMSANSDGKVSPESANLPGGTFGKIYILMEQGGLRTDLGPVSFRAGRLRNHDVVDSPYSLFINSRGTSAMTMELAYEDDLFFFSSRWIELNRGSAMGTPAWTVGFPDRGANLKAFGLKLGELRLGFQDAAVYTGKSFDLEYFANPLPQYFIQYSKTTKGRPWYTGGNENNILGLFMTWDRPGVFSANAQFLMDDFNLHFLGIGNWNPWKAALTVGGSLETPLGRFRLHAAGATEYTFQPIDMYNRSLDLDIRDPAVAAYGYSYYPDTRFDIASEGGPDWKAISIEDNAIGYQYGENNLALQAGWTGGLAGFELDASLEFRLAGENSPVNPWGDLHHFLPGGTRWLAEPLLEKRILLGLSASHRFGDWKAFGSLLGGAALDALTLRPSAGPDAADGGIEKELYIYAPTAGLTQKILRVTLGVSYEWRAR